MNNSVALTNDQVKPASQNHSKVHVTKPSDRFCEGSHGFDRSWGISEKLTGARALSMAFGRLPGHMVASPHAHEFETAIFIIAGRVRVFFGDDLLEFIDVEAGDFLFIPAKLIHCPANFSEVAMDYIVSRASSLED